MPESLNRLFVELESGDDSRAEAAAHELAALGEAALPRLLELASAAGRATGGDGRWWAARTLALIDSPQSAPLLLGLLGDPDPGLRACAIAGLGERRSAEAVPALVDVLADASPFLARLASDALIQIGRAAVPALTQALVDPQAQQRRFLAARALAHLAAPESIPALFHALEDDSSLVQYWADEGLDRLGVGMLYFDAGAGA